MTSICTAARPDRRLIVYFLAILAGVGTGLAIGLPARPQIGPIPPGARVVTVTPVFGASPAFGLHPDISRDKRDHAFTMTNPATVAKIAAVIDGLAPVAPGTYSCPSDNGAAMQLTFRTRPRGPVLAGVTAGYRGCQFVWVTVGARTLPAFDAYTGSELPIQQRVLTIAGVGWPYPPG
jgi:hypothetical protein